MHRPRESEKIVLQKKLTRFRIREHKGQKSGHADAAWAGSAHKSLGFPRVSGVTGWHSARVCPMFLPLLYSEAGRGTIFRSALARKIRSALTEFKPFTWNAIPASILEKLNQANASVHQAVLELFGEFHKFGRCHSGLGYSTPIDYQGNSTSILFPPIFLARAAASSQRSGVSRQSYSGTRPPCRSF